MATPPAHGQRLHHLLTVPVDAAVVIGAVTDVDVLSDGTIAVLDELSHAVLLFDAAGAHVRTLGREGRGPGELAGASEMEAGPDGQLAVLDYRNLRLTVWRSDRGEPRTIPLRDLIGEGFGWPHDFIWNAGAAWLKISRFVPNEPVHVLRLPGDLSRAGDTVVTFVESAPGVATCVYCTLTVSPLGTVAAAAGDTLYRVSELDPAGRARRAWTRADLPAARRSAAELHRLDRASRRFRAAESGDGTPSGFSPFQPRFPGKTIGFDARGRLWTLPSQDTGRASAFDVFDRAGDAPRTIPLDVRVTSFRIRGDMLVAGGERETGEPVVFLFRIEG